jgi:AAA domain
MIDKKMNDEQRGEELIAKAPKIHSAGRFMEEIKRPVFIWEKVLQRNFLYSATAKWGHGKTALCLTMAIHIALGKEFAYLRTKQTKVLYLAGENPDDIRLRVKAICAVYGFNSEELSEWLFFSDRSFSMSDDILTLVVSDRVKDLGDFGLVVVDTGPAHNETDDENSNSEMHKFAVACRDFGSKIGNPALIILMHPPQGATKDNLRTRGGGGFAGQIDGELLLWQHETTKQVELWHSAKFRGAGFSPMFFDLMVVQVDGFSDNFGNEAISVVAVHGEKKDVKDPKTLTGDKRAVYQSLVSLISEGKTVSKDIWRQRFYLDNNQRPEGVRKSKESAKKAFDRSHAPLVDCGLVVFDDLIYKLPKDCDEVF